MAADHGHRARHLMPIDMTLGPQHPQPAGVEPGGRRIGTGYGASPRRVEEASP
jgi:hypothetical protein